MIELIKGLFILKTTPKMSEIMISRKNHNIANILLAVGVLLLLINFVLAVYKILFFNGLKVDVGEFVFSWLMVSIVIALISAAITLLGLLNAHSDYLCGIKGRKYKKIGSIVASYFFTFYMTFFTVNEAALLGLYNERAHESICEVYVTNGTKTDVCIEYEKSMRKERSVRARVFFFLY